MSMDDEHSPGVAFALWLACFLGACGIHRFYLGRPATGLLYLFTFGLLGVGQLVDLIRLRGMVEEENLLAFARQQRAIGGAPARALLGPQKTPEEELRQALLKAAAARGGGVTVAQGVLATGKSFEEVEAALDAMAKKGFAEIDNDPKTGVVVYHFGDLS
jgi:hypothetical protein